MKRSRVVGVVEKVYQLLMINVCFFLTTLPLMIAFIVLKPIVPAIPVYLIASVTLGPTLFSVAHCLIEIGAEKEIAVFRVFFSYWRTVFKRSVSVTSLLAVIVIIGIVDMQFFSRVSFLQWLNPIVILLVFFAVVIYANALFLATMTDDPLRLTLKEACYLAFKKLSTSLVNGLLLVALVLTMIIKPAFGFLVFPSLLMSILIWNSQKLRVNTSKLQ